MRALALSLVLALAPAAASCRSSPEEPPAGPARAPRPSASSSAGPASAPRAGSSLLPPGTGPPPLPPPSAPPPWASAPAGSSSAAGLPPSVVVGLSQRESSDPADTEIQAVLYVAFPVSDPVRLHVTLPKGARSTGGALDEVLSLTGAGQVLRSFRFRGALPSQADPFRLELRGQGKASELRVEKRLPMPVVPTFAPPSPHHPEPLPAREPPAR